MFKGAFSGRTSACEYFRIYWTRPLVRDICIACHILRQSVQYFLFFAWTLCKSAKRCAINSYSEFAMKCPGNKIMQWFNYISVYFLVVWSGPWNQHSLSIGVVAYAFDSLDCTISDVFSAVSHNILAPCKMTEPGSSVGAENGRWRLTLKKTKSMVFTIKRAPTTFNYTLFSNGIEQAMHYNYLEVFLSGNLSWEYHVNHITA